MNLSLIDPFVLAQDYPDTLTEKLSPSALRSISQCALANERQEAGTRHVCASIAKGITLLPDVCVQSSSFRPHQSRMLIDTSVYRWTVQWLFLI
jgi:hypothetical protein